MSKKTQLLTVRPDGSLVGLDFKRGGFNPAPLGARSIVRSTDIAFNEGHQKYFCKFLEGPWNGQALTVDHAVEIGADCLNGSETFGEDRTLYFTDYEDAVAAEVKFIQAARRKGKWL